MKIIRFHVLALLFILPATAYASGHCTTSESVVFSCNAGKKTASVCASPDMSSKSAYVQYRFGPIGAPELSYPERSSDLRRVADAGVFPQRYVVGGWIRFRNGPYQYLVYAQDWESSDGDNSGQNSGIVVLKDGNKLAALKCKDKAAHDFHRILGFIPEISEEEYETVEEIVGL